MRTDRDYADSMELVESVMEWIGMRWTVSMIKRELREYFGKDLSFQTCNYLIKAANTEIRKRYNIDPQYYKGVQIEFYESIIRNKYEKTKNQLTAAERLDKLFGLEQVTADDPEIQARKIRQALKEIDESIGDKNGGEKRNANEGTGKDKSGSGAKSIADDERETNKKNTTTEKSEANEENAFAKDDNVSSEITEELKNLKDEDLKRFRKGKS